MKYRQLAKSSSFSKFVLSLSLSVFAMISTSCGFAAKTNTSVKTESKKVAEKPNDKKNYIDEQIQIAIEDLAKRLNIEPSEVIYLSALQVTWRSGALGCPKAGQIYTQALRPGRLIILSASDQNYRYHSSLDGMPRYCASEQAETPAASRSEI